MKNTETQSQASLTRRVSRRLTSKQWNDVADLCNEAAVACETGYEDHDWQARQKAAKWMMSLAMKAQGKAANGALCESAGRKKTHESTGDVAAPSDSQQQMAMPPSVGNAHNNTKDK